MLTFINVITGTNGFVHTHKHIGGLSVLLRQAKCDHVD